MQSTKRTATALIASIVLLSTLTAGFATATGSTGEHNRTVAVDEHTRIGVTLDDAPAGVQRYNLTVRLENARIADIESASAGDIGAFQVRSQSQESVTFRAADLSESVQAGATNVSLGTLTISSTAPGTSAVSYTVHDFQTDDGEQITPAMGPSGLRAQSADAAATAQSSNGADTAAGQSSVSSGGLPMTWVAVGGAVTLGLLGVVYRWRRSKTTGAQQL